MKLKPCPFCGADAFVQGYAWWRVYCRSGLRTNVGDLSCGIRGPERSTRHGAIVAWNRRGRKARTSDPATPAPLNASTPHEWECRAPVGGFYSWQCKNCTAWRPYPSEFKESDKGPCPRTCVPPTGGT